MIWMWSIATDTVPEKRPNSGTLSFAENQQAFSEEQPRCLAKTPFSSATGRLLKQQAVNPNSDTHSAARTTERARRAMIATEFVNFTRSIENGLQGLVQNVPGAIWLLGMGGLLKRERPALGWLTLVFGFFMLINSLGSLLDNSTLSMIGFSGNLLILPLWAMWIGVDLLRRPALSD